MTRYITCEKCAANIGNEPVPEEIVRKTHIQKLKRSSIPEENQIVIESWDKKNESVIQTEIIPVDEVVCDFCNECLTGLPGVAITIWMAGDPEPPMWEKEFTA